MKDYIKLSLKTLAFIAGLYFNYKGVTNSPLKYLPMTTIYCMASLLCLLYAFRDKIVRLSSKFIESNEKKF